MLDANRWSIPKVYRAHEPLLNLDQWAIQYDDMLFKINEVEGEKKVTALWRTSCR